MRGEAQFCGACVGGFFRARGPRNFVVGSEHMTVAHVCRVHGAGRFEDGSNVLAGGNICHAPASVDSLLHVSSNCVGSSVSIMLRAGSTISGGRCAAELAVVS